MPARLSISTEEGLLLECQLGTQPLRIGRAKENALRSEDRRTSRHHATVRALPSGQYEAEDLGSSYGTLLNGRPIKKETLKHQDILRCGGVLIQFLIDAEPTAQVSDTELASQSTPLPSETLDNLREAQEQIHNLIAEQATLRSAVGTAQQAEEHAKRLRDEAQDEVERLHGVLGGMRQENTHLQARLEDLGRDLRERLSSRSHPQPESEGLRQQLSDALRQSERHKSRAVELEQRDAARMLSEQTLRKEVEQLKEQIQQRETREAQLTQAVKPALLRIAELTAALEQTNLKLAKTEAELGDLKRQQR